MGRGCPAHSDQAVETDCGHVKVGYRDWGSASLQSMDPIWRVSFALDGVSREIKVPYFQHSLASGGASSLLEPARARGPKEGWREGGAKSILISGGDIASA